MILQTSIQALGKFVVFGSVLNQQQATNGANACERLRLMQGRRRSLDTTKVVAGLDFAFWTAYYIPRNDATSTKFSVVHCFQTVE